MSLDVYLGKNGQFFEGNITHNLGEMANKAGIYKTLWRADEMFHAPRARNIIPFLELGLSALKSEPEYYKQFNPSNGWGCYENLVAFVEEYLAVCKKHKLAAIRISR